MRITQSALRIFVFSYKVRYTHLFIPLDTMKTPLRQAREKRNMTLQDLATRVNSDVGNLSRIERGVQIPSSELAAKICEQFDGDINELHLIYPERFIAPAPNPAASP